MTETQKRIREYKKALPHLKERVIAVAILLAISVTMITSVSFAWMTISRAPEVNGLATTISTNGNLEIALSDTDGLAPDESAVGDGNGSVLETNLKWGNLVNLSNAAYGLDKITLRPASLSRRNLTTNPMYAVRYGEDGRVTGYTNDFAFSNYNGMVFEVPDETRYGVRAVSSVTYSDYKGEKFIIDQVELINTLFNSAEDKFNGIYGSENYMSCIGGVVGVYVDYTMNGTDASCKAYYDGIVEMAVAFKQCMETAGQAIVEVANLYYYIGLTNTSEYEQNKFTFADLVDTTSDRYADMTGYASQMISINTFRSAWTKTMNAYTGITVTAKNKLDTTGDITWTGLATYFNYLCNVNTATINGMTVADVKSQAKTALDNMNISALLGLLDVLNDPLVIIKDGAIKDADQLLSGSMHVAKSKAITIHVNFRNLVKRDVQPTIETNATDPFLIPTDISAAEITASEGGTNSKGDPIAAETYAMAIDFWVRTNSANSLLILEGSVITQPFPMYDEDGNPIMEEKRDEAGNVVTDSNGDPVMVQRYEDRVVGYQGVNRVWDELDDPNSGLIPNGTTSITQGTGSCYVFYPQSPEDQEQSLKLLAAMRVAFVDSDGTLLAEARMNTNTVVEDAGRIIVPLQLEANDPIEIDDEGTTLREYIMPMVRDQAERITAIIYLEGTSLSNSDVLAAGSITGQLNLQFGTTDMTLDPLDDEIMEDHFSFEFDQTTFDFPENATEWEVPLRLTIAGRRPSVVKANFVSVISATQGAKQDEFTFTLDEASGKYLANVEFPGPGNYQLRALQLDGVDYALNDTSIVTVTIPGLTVQTLTWNSSSNMKSAMTAEFYWEESFDLVLNASSQTIPSVKGVFLGDNGQNITINFTSSDGRNYHGTAKFTGSGKYKMTYVLIDGAYTPLDDEMYKSLDVKLGLRAEIYLTKPVLSSGKVDENTLKVSEPYDSRVGWQYIYQSDINDPVKIGVICYLYDDQGKKIEGWEGATLYYGTGGTDSSLDAPLEWNGDYYTGNFITYRNGVFKFRHVRLSDINYVSHAISAPNINSISPDPMEFIGWADGYSEDLTFDLGATERYMYMALRYAKSANIVATLKNGNETVEVTGELVDTDSNNVSVYRFALPATQADGTWTMVSATASQVFYGETEADAKYYDGQGAEGFLDLTPLLQASKPITTTFITKVSVSASSATAAQNDGKFSFNGKFMESTYKVNDIVLTFNAYDGKPVTYYAEKAGVTLKLDVDGDYYWAKNTEMTISSTPAAPAIKATGAALNSNGQYAIPELSFTVDGKYNCTLSVTLKDADGNVLYTNENVKLPEVTVTWTAPTVQITSSSPSTTVTNAYVSHKSGSGWGNTDITVTEYSAGVNAEKTVANVCFTATKRYYKPLFATYEYCDLTQPTVTITLSNSGEISNATLSFGGTGYVYATTGSSTKSAYTWTKDGTSCTRYIGLYTDNSGSDTRTIAGTMTANQLVLTDSNGVEYTFTIPTLTINNPY